MPKTVKIGGKITLFVFHSALHNTNFVKAPHSRHYIHTSLPNCSGLKSTMVHWFYCTNMLSPFCSGRCSVTCKSHDILAWALLSKLQHCTYSLSVYCWRCVTWVLQGRLNVSEIMWMKLQTDGCMYPSVLWLQLKLKLLLACHGLCSPLSGDFCKRWRKTQCCSLYRSWIVSQQS